MASTKTKLILFNPDELGDEFERVGSDRGLPLELKGYGAYLVISDDALKSDDDPRVSKLLQELGVGDGLYKKGYKSYQTNMWFANIPYEKLPLLFSKFDVVVVSTLEQARRDFNVFYGRRDFPISVPQPSPV